jgi:hypothetical protein
MPRDLARYYVKPNFIIIYPEQHSAGTQTLSASLDGLEVSPIQENIDRYTNLSTFKRKSAGNGHNFKTE